jgi:hypothetical protein
MRTSLLRRRRPASAADPRDPRLPLNVLHIGKTGGTALKQVLAQHRDQARYQLLFRGHEVTLADVPEGERFMFLLRDPVTRFVSAFNGRLREDRPRYHYPWRSEEQVAFAYFRSPEQLAAALSSENPIERDRARQAMHGIGHVNTSYWFWFGDEAAFRHRVSDLFFIGFQEQLDEDFALLKQKLGLPAETRLSHDPVAAHRAPAGSDVQVGETARANLERWYERDLELVAMCRELAPLVNAAPDVL